MGKSKPKVDVTLYYMSMHFGICHGPLDYISQIIVNEKEAWAGQQIVQGDIDIDKEDLFGGKKKEGGVDGTVHYLPGDTTQTIPEDIAAKHGRTTATMPAYRGIASAFFHSGRDEDGFYWTANSPYLPGVWIKAARASTALNDAHARIYRAGSTNLIDESLDLGTLGTGNRSWKWDTNGDYFVWGEGGSGPVVYDLPGGESRVISTTATSSAVHLNGFGELVTINSNTLNVHSASSGSLLQSLDVTASGLNSGFDADDVTIGDTTYMLMVRFQFAGTFSQYWQLLERDSGGDFSLEHTTLVTNKVASVSMGPTYAYCIPGNGEDIGGDAASDTMSIVRVAWSGSITETVITPPELTGFIAVCHYDKATGYVLIVCRNGDIFQYSADLSTLINSQAGNGFTLTTDALLSKRLKLSQSTFGLRDTDLTLPRNTIYQFSSTSLELVTTILGTGYPADGTAFTRSGMNQTWFGAFMVGHLLPSAFWFLGQTGEFDSNPSHIIYDCLTNTDWGMGAAASAIDFDSFEDAGAVLYAENFGLSMIWTKQSTIEAFISEVIDHIEATLFVSPLTGLLTLKLIRDDYSITGLPEFTPDNSVVTNFGRKLWGETINEIVVTWTNPENEEEETVVAQDNANIEAQGGIVSDGRNYYGVRVKDLAMRLAQRDLRAASTPLASCDIEVNREAWNLLPGDVVILNSPEDDIVSIVMRVGPVDYGKPGDSKVRAQLVEDIFSLPLAEYTVPPDTEWESTSEEPSPADNSLIFTLPYYLVVNEVDPSVSAEVTYPEVFAGVLASEAGQDTDEFELYGEVVDAAGITTVDDLGTKTIASRATLQVAIDAEVETIFVSFPNRTQGNGPKVGGLMLIEGADETDSELCLVTSFGDSPAGYTMKRGVLDTVPRAWPIGTPVWFVDVNMVFADETIRSEAEIVEYQVRTRTSLGLLALASAPVITETLTARPHLPLRPANVKVNGDDGFSGIVDLTGIDPIPVTWARRNRLTEDAVILAWDAADVTPEAGQTTTVTLTDLLGNELFAYTGIAGTSQNVDPTNFGGEVAGYIVVSSVRDGLDSLQGYRIRVILDASFAFEFEDDDSYEFEDDELKLFEN